MSRRDRGSWPRCWRATGRLLLVFWAPDAVGAEVSPHGEAEGCSACHIPEEPPSEGDSLASSAGALRAPVVALCRSCHPTADMHLVGVTPVATRVPAGWPLETGRITCATCHAEPAHSVLPGSAHLAQLPSPYHRGGPYPDSSGLCFQCHTRTEYVRQDPHHAQEENTCSACHTGRPEKGASPEVSRLRVPGSGLCMGCHTGPPHQGALPHLGQPLTPNLAADVKGILALDEGKVACFTCHDVHTAPAPVPPAGGRLVDGLRAAARADAGATGWSVLQHSSLVWPGGGRAEHPPMLARPLGGPPGESLCAACHGAGPDVGGSQP